MNVCNMDYKTCGHCMVCFDGPYGYEARPFCDKASFIAMALGNDTCPNAPFEDEEDKEVSGECVPGAC